MLNLTEFQSTFFTINSQPDGSVLACLKRPQLTEQDNLEQLGQELSSLIENYGVRRLTLNLERLTYLTSSAIGRLIALHRQLNRVEGRLVLCSAGDEVRQILETAHLLGYFHVVGNPQDASLLMMA